MVSICIDVKTCAPPICDTRFWLTLLRGDHPDSELVFWTLKDSLGCIVQRKAHDFHFECGGQPEIGSNEGECCQDQGRAQASSSR